MTVKIYFFGPMDRSGRVRWLLEEMGIAYEDKALNYQEQEHKKPEYLAINPTGTVPTVEIDGKILMESAGICAYLADKYLDKEFAPALDSPNRGEYTQWMFFVPATIEPILTEAFRSSGLSEEERNAKLAEVAEKFKMVENILTKALEGKEFLVDNKFSAADILVCTTLHWANQFKMISEGSSLHSYVERLKERSAAQKVGVFLPIPGQD